MAPPQSFQRDDVPAQVEALREQNRYMAGRIAELEVRVLTADEAQRLRDLIKADDRATWLWSSLKVWAAWITGVVVALTVGLDFLRRLLAGIKGGG
ncbi:MAG: hypothetical protein OEU93_08070 [Rubrivivax sp.]|nr:hypothetical protein [Rubrivivax sp.]MDH5338989.1 hypothetical protein [Rubrivivax sp.]